jgi:hypothetical protein
MRLEDHVDRPNDLFQAAAISNARFILMLPMFSGGGNTRRAAAFVDAPR